MTTHELLLANHPFLRVLPPVHLDALANAAMRRNFTADELIFREGDPANRFYLIQRGHVEVDWRDANGELVPVERLGPGETLGWSWLFPPYHTHFEARAGTGRGNFFLRHASARIRRARRRIRPGPDGPRCERYAPAIASRAPRSAGAPPRVGRHRCRQHDALE